MKYTEIKDLANSFSDILILTEYGEHHIGESFMILRNNFDKVVSFIFTSYSISDGDYYKCIYKDKL